MDHTIVKDVISKGIDKTAIKNFAVYARNKFMNDIKNKAAMIGVTESGIQDPLSSSTGNIQLFDIGMQEPYRIEGIAIQQRKGLIRELKKRTEGSTYLKAYETLIEEVAYTWFNRIIAIRFMEVNNYMPNRMRVLSSGVEGVNEPEFVTHVLETSFDFSEAEKEWIIELKTDGSNLATDELFQYLFIKQCNTLNANLPELFEKTNDYTELLLTVSYNDVEGVIYKLVHSVPETNFNVNSESGNGQVEIIGWLYQFYNTEPKASVFGRPKTKKIDKQDIPAATQLFTPEWIVRYMVENSLGRLWIDKLLANDDSRTEKKIADDFGWRYYLPEAEQDESVQKQLKNIRNERKNLSVEDISFLDPAMGSFHIGIYAFDLFMQLYESEGYTTKEAARLIVEKNLHGLDIDKRASQLSYFTCMMQARKYNRRILEGNLQPNVYEIPESYHINREHLNYLGIDIEDKEEWYRLKLQLVSLLNIFIDAKEYGSLIDFSDKYKFIELRNFVISHSVDSQISLLETVGLEETQKDLMDIINVAEIISRKYDVVSTNPPYMSSSGMDKKLSDFAKKYYPYGKSDMFAMFIERCNKFTTENGYYSMITQHAWMFLSSYEKLRKSLLMNTLVNMAHLGTRAFEEIGGEVVQTTSFVYLNKSISKYTGNYIKLTDFYNQSKKEVAYLGIFNGHKKKYHYETKQAEFNKIPGSPIAYWVPESLLVDFEIGTPMDKIVDPKQGLATANNNRFLRYWYEVDINKIKFDATSIEESVESGKKWFPYNKGGSRRQWYGNYDYVVNWENNGEEIRNFKDEMGKQRSVIRNPKFHFRESMTWPLITSGGFSIRYREPGSIHDVAGMSAFSNDHNQILYLLGLLGTKVANYIFKILNPTLNLQVGDFNNFPVIKKDNTEVIELVQENIEVSKKEWNSYEEAWEYIKHPFLENLDSSTTLEDAYLKWEELCDSRIRIIKNNEELLNHKFIEIYDLENELNPTVDEKNITLRLANENNSIKSFISYAVGCMFGRYSLNKEGLVHAGGEFDLDHYTDFKPSEDNVILLTDEGYFPDDILSRFEEFLSITFGKENLEENLNFMANALNKGHSSRDIIREYLLNDFYKNHIQIYKKRPIYWLYDSGKQNGFKALVYMHRYDEDTTGKVRVDYLHQIQRAYERNIASIQDDIANSKDAKETSQLQKRLEKLTKQLKECRDYDERLGHMALERVPIDLDDGIKVNYEKVQTDSKGNFHQILAKIK